MNSDVLDFERVLRRLPSAVLISVRGEVRFANARAAEVLRRHGSELIGSPLSAVLGVPSLPDGHTDLRVELVDGEERDLGLTARHDGETVTIIFRDMLDVQRLREERDRLMRLAAIGEALPSLLHELKNPLAAIMTTVELLIEDLPSGELQHDLHAVLSELRRMKLGFEGLGAVHGRLDAPRPEAIDYACREACRVLLSRAQQKKVHFVHLVEQMPLLPLHSAAIRGLIFNFVTNSIHACRPHDAVRLEAGYRTETQAFELSVVDTGRGMAPEVLEKATDLFFTTKTSGSGIGLALCKRMIEEAGGTMEMKSVPGFGTMVSVVIPTGSSGS